ncbi:uncharacterized protein LOC133202339 [Saccostrea echinata]|uniref:uncharacterized protein LOC133202339 n=1 Tax=Saccostrea echinata TaxID=191078 RepID=UPI002A823DCB|nr:uncharacterized protein LOC133202339 [Saccostrea echinata]
MRSFVTLAVLALVSVAAVHAQNGWDFDDIYDDDLFDDDRLIYIGGYAPSYGPLSTGYAMGVGSGMGYVMGSGMGYARMGKSGKAMYIPYAVPTPVTPPVAPSIPLELALGSTQTQNNGIFGGNGAGLLLLLVLLPLLLQNTATSG